MFRSGSVFRSCTGSKVSIKYVWRKGGNLALWCTQEERLPIVQPSPPLDTGHSPLQQRGRPGGHITAFASEFLGSAAVKHRQGASSRASYWLQTQIQPIPGLVSVGEVCSRTPRVVLTFELHCLPKFSSTECTVVALSLPSFHTVYTDP